MRRLNLSTAFAERAIDEPILKTIAVLFTRLIALIFALPVAIAVYHNFFIDSNPAGILFLTLYAGLVLIAIKPETTNGRRRMLTVAVLLLLAGFGVVWRTQSVSGASFLTLFASVVLLLSIGLRRTLLVTLVYLGTLFWLYSTVNGDALLLDLMHLTVAGGSQLGMLVLLNLLFLNFLSVNEELEQANRLSDLASSHARIGMFRHDDAMDQWRVNKVYRQMYGLSDSQTIHGGEHILSATHPDDRERVLEALKRQLDSGESLRLTHRLMSELGERWVDVYVNRRVEQGKTITYGSIIDIHEQRLKEIELESLRLKHTLANTVFELGIVDGPLSTKQMMLDENAMAILGFSGAMASQSCDVDTLLGLLAEPDRQKAIDLINDLNSNNKPVEFNFKLSSESTSEARWIRGMLTTYSDIDNQACLLAVVEDVSEEIRAKIELEVSARERHQLLEQLKLVTDEADIRIVEENFTSGLTSYITHGKSLRQTPPSYKERMDLVPEEYREALNRAYSEPGASGEYPIIGTQYQTGVSWLRQLYVRNYQRDGEEIAIFMVTDITKQKRAQLQLERSFNQLERSLTRLDEIAVAGKIGMFEWSRDSDILRPNSIFRDQTELSEALYPIISTRNFFELFDDNEGITCFNELREAEPDSPPAEYQLKMRLNSGEIRWVRLIASVHQSEGEGAKVSGSLIDLTSHLELELQLREANKALQRQSRTDPLTLLANRRELDDFLFTQYGMRQRDPHSYLSLLMIDIDYFKDYNDLYGHSLGDKALKCVADLMRQVARRPADLVARFGGEEFVIVLPDTDAEGALQLSQQIQLKLDQEKILHEASVFKQLTLSVGAVSLKPEQTLTPAELIEAADAALYAAKAAGRNRIEFAKSL